jgi:hypothetical protein
MKKVKYIDANGNVRYITEEEADRIPTNTVAKPNNNLAMQGRAGLSGLTRGATAGLSTLAKAGIDAALDPNETYSEALKRERENVNYLKKAYPKTSTGGNILGNIAGFMGPGKILTAGSTGVAKLAGKEGAEYGLKEGVIDATAYGATEAYSEGAKADEIGKRAAFDAVGTVVLDKLTRGAFSGLRGAKNLFTDGKKISDAIEKNTKLKTDAYNTAVKLKFDIPNNDMVNIINKLDNHPVFNDRDAGVLESTKNIIKEIRKAASNGTNTDELQQILKNATSGIKDGTTNAAQLAMIKKEVDDVLLNSTNDGVVNAHQIFKSGNDAHIREVKADIINRTVNPTDIKNKTGEITGKRPSDVTTSRRPIYDIGRETVNENKEQLYSNATPEQIKAINNVIAPSTLVRALEGAGELALVGGKGQSSTIGFASLLGAGGAGFYAGGPTGVAATLIALEGASAAAKVKARSDANKLLKTLMEINESGNMLTPAQRELAVKANIILNTRVNEDKDSRDYKVDLYPGGYRNK